MLLRFAYSWLFFITIPLLLLVFLYRFWWYRTPAYCFPLADYLHRQKATAGRYHRYMLNILRTFSLLLLVLLLSRPQWIDEESRVNVEGVDIVIALDISGSMSLIDDLTYKKTRIQVAQDEAIRFIRKRHNDPIGIVVFANQAMSKCPLTLDKSMLEETVLKTQIGDLNPDGTWLGTGLATAINRLKNSLSKSKVIIFLTDGQPTVPEAIEPDTAITLAQEFGVKVYTIGVGSDHAYAVNSIFGLQRVAVGNYNEALLKKIAEKTGAQFFAASNAAELRTIYDTIDKLEKIEYEVDIFHHHYEAFFIFVWILLALLASELCLRLFVWRGIQ